MQSRTTQHDDRAGYLGWTYDELSGMYYHPYQGAYLPPSPHPALGFASQQASAFPASSAFTPSLMGLNPNAQSPTRQYLLSPLTPSPSSYGSHSPPPVRAPSPIFSVPPSFISEAPSCPLSPVLTYYRQMDAYPSPSLSLAGNSLVGLGCDSPASDSLDYDTPFNISKGWRDPDDVCLASLRLQEAVDMSPTRASHQIAPQALPLSTRYPSSSPTALTAPRLASRPRDQGMRPFATSVPLQPIAEDEQFQSPRAEGTSPFRSQLQSPFAESFKTGRGTETPKT
ncbi:hypothetical protein P7C70_g8223, partial [Phenoliferia sp. Uapishka_3]